MADIKINLLPWREELREERKQEFLKVLGGVALLGALVVFAGMQYFKGEIESQDDRNGFLTAEIKVLESRIAEIKLLQQKRNELLARMKVIQELQGNRPVIVRLFDELARRLADRVYFTSLSYNGKSISVDGVAESNNRISSQLRNFDESEWFDKPNVTGIVADPKSGPQASRFKLEVQQGSPSATEVE
ncbi:MAG: type IV pilus assembly protein PilN [Candidatus Pseudothioglobus sp.]|jgi:type IV pilus assembly protein PilN